MKVCTKCVLPETVDTLGYDDEGVCSVCRQIEFKDEKIDWEQRRKMLDQLVEKHKGNGLYDCVVPYSGGKDSTFQLWYIVTQLKLKPLVIRFNHWGYRPLIAENNARVFKKLGVDVIEFTPSWHVVRELMLESFKRRGDFCWHCHTGIYGGVMHMAVKFGVPLVLWGESTAEYHSWYTYEEMELVDEKRFNRLMNQGMTADDMYEFLDGRVEKRDLWMFTYPPRRELMNLKVHSTCLGNYIPWDVKKNTEIIHRELGWNGQRVEGVPPEYPYEKIECAFQGMRDYSKYVKRGYGRTNHLVSIDIRNNRIAREEGVKLVEKYDGKRPASMDWFLKILDLSEDEFYAILEDHKVHPWEFNRDAVQTGERMPDMDQWDDTKVGRPVGPAHGDGNEKSKYL